MKKAILMSIIALISIIAIVIKLNTEELSYKIIKQTEYDTKHKQAGYYVTEQDGKTNIIISMGEHSTGGYEIKISKVDIKNNEVTIYVEEIYPKSNQTVTDAFTYPSVEIEFNKTPKKITVKSINNKYEYKKIN